MQNYEDAWDEKQKAWGRNISMNSIAQAEISRKDKLCYMCMGKGYAIAGGPHSAMKPAKMIKCEKCNGTGKI